MPARLGLGLSQGTPNVDDRTTTVTARVTISYDKYSYNGENPSGTLVVDGQSFDFNANFNYAGQGQGPAGESGSTTAYTRTVRVSYGAATTRTISASATYNAGGGSGQISASNSINLTTIPAASGSGGSGSGSGSGSEEEPWEPDTPPNAPWQGNATVEGQASVYQRETEIPYVDNEGITLISFADSICIVRFKTPKFTGSSKSIDVYLGNTEAQSILSAFNISYALCESDENYWMYIGAGDVVNDPSLIAQGTLTHEEWELMPFSIETTDLVGEKYYYLIFWLAQDAQGTVWQADMGKSTYHQIRVNYIDAPVVSTTIYGESGIQNTYEIMIDNGTGWDTYQAFIDNGTKFEPYT